MKYKPFLFRFFSAGRQNERRSRSFSRRRRRRNGSERDADRTDRKSCGSGKCQKLANFLRLCFIVSL